ncbi:single-stranded DNA-binding protein [Nocardia sp. NPDC050799]|uniref:single-stranded DNA-binding protein n=1 Tax=Nocardia sp. NPDC050799 TaxID=3154842 RepID=UPI0033F2C7FF
MSWDTLLVVKGNLAADVELKFTPAGYAVANFTVVSTPRYFDRAAGEYRDGEPVFTRCTAWRQTAENLAESLRRGSRVIVVGRLKQRSWQTSDGQNRSITELDVDDVGPSLRNATAAVRRTHHPSTANPTGPERGTPREPVGATAGDTWSGSPGF